MSSRLVDDRIMTLLSRLLALAAIFAVLNAVPQNVVAGSLEGAEVAAHKNPLQEASGKASEVMQALGANIRKAWTGLAEGQKDAGHLMVVALNEVRKYKLKLERDLARKDLGPSHTLTAGIDESTKDDDAAALGQTKTPTSFEQFVELARQQEAQQEPKAAPSTAAERKEQALKSIKKRTFEMVKGLFLDELLEVAKLLMLIWLKQEPSQATAIAAIANRLKTRMIKYLVGIFLDLIPVISGRNQNEFDDVFKQTLRDCMDDDFDGETVMTTTENPYNWMLHSMID